MITTPKKPLVIDAGQLRQLPTAAELDIPLEERFQRLKSRFDVLVTYLLTIGLEIPEDILQENEDA